MEWSRKYALRSYLRSSLWVVPVLAYVAAFVLARLVSAFDAWLGWSWEWRLQVSTVQSSLEGRVTATISFMSSRSVRSLSRSRSRVLNSHRALIATTLLRDSTIRSVVALFVLTLSFGLMTLARSQTEVQYLLLSCAVALGAASTAAFIYLIDYAARLLRPVSMCGAWARRGSGSSSRFIRRR
jgi:hypothetical protein